MSVDEQPVSNHPTGHVVDVTRVPDAPLAPPGQFGGVKGMVGSRYLLWLLVRREVAARYQGQLLGMLWSYVQPFTRFAIYFFMMGLVMGMHKNVPQFGIHMWAGFVFLDMFTGMLTSGTNSVVRNRSLVQRMAMPREMFPVSAVIVTVYQAIPPFVILLVACGLSGWSPDGSALLYGLVGFGIMLFLGAALALLCSAANVFLRDFKSVVGVVTSVVTFSVPMMYPFERVATNFSPGWQEVYLLNPLSNAVLLLQRCFWAPTTSEAQQESILSEGMPSNLLERGLIWLGVSIALLFISQWIFAKLQPRFPERL